ncbi:hypothetical protein Ddye_019494 [Dipteronia dyeriana]|uniref:Uncharacterized protein n=1 Tax=Dipteronia dyeriana TaxID=168575 RepID=A0AAD9TYZ6_9ROSI|nr:hypothetical protein Ddye_019494 [Dipteronia dyeriana]
MTYYSSNYIDSYVGASYQTPYGGNYDIIPSQAFVAPSSDEFSNQNFSEYNLTPYYGGYDPATNRYVVAYSASTYSKPKSIMYDLYNGSYSPEVVTQCGISYSVSELNDLDFEEYDPTPYDGGYDLAQTYGKPIPHSEAICYPRPMLDSSTPPCNGFTDWKGNSEDSARKPYIESKETPANEVGQLVEYKTDHGQDVKPPGGSGFDEGNSYEYEYEKITQQIPSGYGLEAMDLCEGIFGYWPCLAKYNNRGHDGQQVANLGENDSNQWKETADYLFGSSYPYEERSGGESRIFLDV